MSNETDIEPDDDADDFETSEEIQLVESVRGSMTPERLPIRVEDIARSQGRSPYDPVIRLAIWRAIERVRKDTGIQLVVRRGELRETTPKEQLREAEKRFETAAARLERGYEIGALALVRDPGLASAYERQLERQARRACAEDAALQSEIEDRRRAAVLRGGKT